MRIKLLYIGILLFSVLIIICGKKRSIGASFILKNTSVTGGDLYDFCEIEQFKEHITYGNPSQGNATLEDCDIITLGDSFFASSLDSNVFAIELAKKGGYKVFNINSRQELFASEVDMPLAYLESIRYKPARQRWLILESAERYSMERAELYNVIKKESSADNKSFLQGKLFNHADVKYFFYKNRFLSPIHQYIKNLKFRMFGIMDNSVASYSSNPKMLFFREEVAFNKRTKSPDNIDSVVKNITALSNTLKQKYNIQLLYVVIPNKYSIYNDYLNAGYHYDNYIPSVAQKLSSNHVQVVDLYTNYMKYKKIPNSRSLYFGSDTHYTPVGKDILVEECVKIIDGALPGNGSNPSNPKSGKL